MENQIALVESEIAKIMNRLRKEVAGKGAKKTEVRIVDDVIFSKLTLELSDMEARLIRHIQSDAISEYSYYSEYRKSLPIGYKDCLSFIHPDLMIISIYFNTDLDSRYLFTTLILNKNLENMIRTGAVKLPKKA
jgi:uncharacterized protein YbcI